MFYEITKRIIDIIVSLIILIIFSPVFLIVPILIKLDSPGPVFPDTPPRVGKDKKLFKMYKILFCDKISMVSSFSIPLRRDMEFWSLLFPATFYFTPAYFTRIYRVVKNIKNHPNPTSFCYR